MSSLERKVRVFLAQWFQLVGALLFLAGLYGMYVGSAEFNTGQTSTAEAFLMGVAFSISGAAIFYVASRAMRRLRS